MKAIIIDDEKHCQDALSQALHLLKNEVELIGIADSLASGVKLIEKATPDLVFLDVELQDGQGFNLFSEIESPNFQVIFTTAYSKYAVKAFRFSALDFLLKPIDNEELLDAINKAQNSLTPNSSQLNVLKTAMNTKDLPNKIVLKNIDVVHLVEVENIVWCQADGSYTKFQLRNGEEIMVSKNLREYEKLLQPYGFHRTHRSYILQIKYIKKFNNLESTLQVEGDYTLPTSLSKEGFLKLVTK